MSEKIYTSILTPLPLTSRADGDKVLTLWETLLPDYLPDKYGNWEPLKHTFDLSHREEILDAWQWGLFTKKAKPRSHRVSL